MLDPNQARAAAILADEEALTRAARAQLDAVVLIVIAKLEGLPEPEEARRIITALPAEYPDA